ncbi:hypothetical protein [Acinetobacter guerrae]|uniref:hypothetical protein n=1 Tax=Acinetobacter guerrae TaxID=1843371 RepID=UPI00125F9DDF|nr:hypothetical protein [Acinetobacter guerrae]
MKHEIILPIPLLKAASLCAAENEDWRPMLENIAIDNGHIVATNGHIMFFSPLDDVYPEIKIQIPKPHVDSFLNKIESFSSYRNCKLMFDTDLDRGHLEIPNGYCAFESFKQHFKYAYIDWKKVVPEYHECSFINNDMPIFNPQYLQTMVDISQALGEIACHKVTPLGQTEVAIVKFFRTNYPDAQALIMPMIAASDKVLYCVEIVNEPDSEPEQLPAESADIAFAAAERMRKEISYSIGGNDGFFQPGNWVRPALWLGSPQDHKNKMFYTQEWFKKPLRKFNNADAAKAYMIETADCVQCIDDDRFIDAQSIDEIDLFFGEGKL